MGSCLSSDDVEVLEGDGEFFCGLLRVFHH